MGARLLVLVAWVTVHASSEDDAFLALSTAALGPRPWSRTIVHSQFDLCIGSELDVTPNR